jgi:hypothetical protein
MLNRLSARVPTIVVVTLCAALVGYWANVPEGLPYGLAIVVGVLALMQMAARDRRARVAPVGEPDDGEDESWLTQELAGKGSPAGSYLLGFFSLVTIVLTGFQGAYALPAWAALALSAAWGVANARFVSHDGGTR